MATALLGLLGLATLTAAGADQADLWTAASGPVTVSVDRVSFAYSIKVLGSGKWLANGQVAMTCGGRRYTSGTDGNNLTGGEITMINGTDPNMGGFSAVQRT